MQPKKKEELVPLEIISFNPFRTIGAAHFDGEWLTTNAMANKFDRALQFRI